eukprot:1082309-Pyramimonas_sp.AAC.1
MQHHLLRGIEGHVSNIAQPMLGMVMQRPHSALRELMRGRSSYLSGPPEDALAPHRPGLPSLPDSIERRLRCGNLFRGERAGAWRGKASVCCGAVGVFA